MFIAQRTFVNRYYDVGRDGEGGGVVGGGVGGGVGTGHVVGGGVVWRRGGEMDDDGEEVEEDNDGEDNNDYDKLTVVASGGGGGGKSKDLNDIEVVDDDGYEEVIEEDWENDVIARGDDDVDSRVSKGSLAPEEITGGVPPSGRCVGAYPVPSEVGVTGRGRNDGAVKGRITTITREGTESIYIGRTRVRRRSKRGRTAKQTTTTMRQTED